MKNKKRTLFLTIAFLAGLIINCNCQLNEFSISGSWKAEKGFLITSYCFPTYNPTPDEPIVVTGLKFIFNDSTVFLNKTFQSYSHDSAYLWFFSGIDTKGNSNYKIAVKVLNQNNIKIIMDYLYGHYMDRNLYYVIYLKRD